MTKSETMSRLELNKTIGQRYHLRSILGEGGFGTVFNALQSPLDRPVAVKVCHSAAEDPTAMARFEREARIIADLRSPHTVRLYDYGETEDGFPYFAMEFIAGQTLAEELSLGTIEPSRVARILSEICESLAEAHAKGVLHLDLKPANIMVESISGRGEITRVLDFGIARMVKQGDRRETNPLGLTGTPRYMAPERLLGGPTTPATDIYGLGLILDECLRGTPTFAKTKTPLLLARHFDAIPPLPADTPDGLVRLRDQLLEKDPDNRPATANAVRRSLEEWRLTYEQDMPESRSRRLSGPLSPLAPTEDIDPLPHRGTPYDGTHQGVTIIEQEITCHLPYHATPFIGRARLLAALSISFSDQSHRLVTLGGTGGVGKTRLAIQHGQEEQRQYPGGVWFCDLSDVHSLEGICSVIAHALNVPLGIGPPIEQLAKILAGKGRCLVILDNFEQLVEHAQATLGQWLSHAPLACFLVTSREALRIQGEHVISVTPFPMNDAVKLFCEYADRAAPGFEPSAMNRPLIEAIIRDLDHLPLAIELAAQRLRTLGLEQLQDRLAQRFRVLRARGKTASDRQSTMHATIDWSWSLLDPVEQSVFAQASLFRGGFTLDAAEAVIHLSSGDRFDLEEVVGALVDKHLLQRSAPVDGMVRFTMYESLREYAAERQAQFDSILDIQAKAGDCGARTAAVQRRHSAYYSAYGQPNQIKRLNGAHVRAFIPIYTIEMENFRQAFNDSIHAERLEEAWLLASAMTSIYEIQGPLSLGFKVLRRLIEEDLPDHLAGPVWLKYAAWCLLQHMLGEFERAVIEARVIITRLADPALEVRLGCMNTFYLASKGKAPNAREIYETYRSTAQELADVELERRVLDDFSRVICNQGDLKLAIPLAERAIQLANELQDFHGSARDSMHLGKIHDHLGNRRQAETLYLSAMERYRRLGFRVNLCTVLGNLAFLYAAEGRHAESLALYTEALEIQKAVGFSHPEAYTIGNIGDLLADMGRNEEAIQHLEEAVGLCDAMEDQTGSGAFRASLALLLAKKGQVETALDMAEKGEALLDGVDLIEFGIALCKRAQIDILAQRESAAMKTLERAEAIALDAQVSSESTLARTIATVRAICP